MSVDVHAGYALMVLLGAIVMLAFPLTRDLRSSAERRSYYVIQGITLLGALVGAKFAVLMGDALWPLQPYHDWPQLLVSGRSIAGALLFGFLTAELAKPLLGYRLPPNDRFAVILPISIGIGRIGCLLAGCCQGLPYSGWGAMRDAEGVLRHPAPVYEMVFQFAFAALLWQLYRHGRLQHRLFALYLIGYGVFRFASEFLRDTAKAFAGYSAYQWMALMMVVLGAITLWLRSPAREDPQAQLQMKGASR